jgi:DNA-binding transcriptional LysR family regulator
MALDRLQAMNVFVKVVEHGSFARAAERLVMSTSAVSRYVAELETHLDTRLLNRTTRRISLTESGHAYYERALQLLADLAEAEAIAGSSTAKPKGTIRLTCSINFGVKHLAPAMGLFQAAHPEVLFDISVSDRFVDLVEEGLDLAVRIGDLGNTNLIARKIGQMQLIPCASPAYLTQHGTPRHPSELAGHNCLTYDYAPVKNQWTFRERLAAKAGRTVTAGEEVRVRVGGSVHGNNGELLAAIAAEGVGITFEPDFIVNQFIEAGRLVPILKNWRPPPSPIYAVYPSRRHLSAKVRSFVDFLAAHFAQQRGWT